MQQWFSFKWTAANSACITVTEKQPPQQLHNRVGALTVQLNLSPGVSSTWYGQNELSETRLRTNYKLNNQWLPKVIHFFKIIVTRLMNDEWVKCSGWLSPIGRSLSENYYHGTERVDWVLGRRWRKIERMRVDIILQINIYSGCTYKYVSSVCFGWMI